MKRRRTGAACTNEDNMLSRWSGSRRSWEMDKDWDSFVCAAEQVSEGSLQKDKNGDNELLKTTSGEDENRKK